ncbi:MAG: hypothetical protein ABI824_16500 [Acidobacteriota bacterium]
MLTSLVPGLAVLLVLAPCAAAQIPSDIEKRVSELEEKMRMIDPAFGKGTNAQDLLRRLDLLEQKLDGVLAASAIQPLPTTPTPLVQQSISAQTPGIAAVSVTGDYQTSPNGETRLPVVGYMDFHANKQSGDPYQPDFHRFVLLFGHSFSDRIKFWSELELEHSLLEPSEGVGGEIALEQAYLDFLIKPYFNIRSGMVLAPIGIINERHEPPAFNGVERPFVETTIIPTTWRELGVGVTGDLGRGFRYRAYLTSSLDASRFDAESGIAEGRTKGLDSSFRNPAKVARLEYAGVRRLTLGASVYTGHAGYNLPGLNPNVTIAEVDSRYSFRRFDVRGLLANTWLSRAGELNHRLQLETGQNPNVASQMRGYYVEPAYHLLPRRARHDVIVFGRYEKYNTQQQMPLGYLPLSQFNRSSWVTGVTYKPVADVAIKFDYNFNRNESAIVRAVNGINLGIGWWF